MAVFDSNARSRRFAFLTFKHQVSVGYALVLFEGVTLYGQEMEMRQRLGAVVDNTYPDMMKRHYTNVESNRVGSLPCCLNQAGAPCAHRALSYGRGHESYSDCGYEQGFSRGNSYRHHSSRHYARDSRQHHYYEEGDEQGPSHSRHHHNVDGLAGYKGPEGYDRAHTYEKKMRH